MINVRYQLHEKLGQGGMGTVYRATDRLTGDTIALKQIITNTSKNDEAYRLALSHEFQTLAGLRHPHIISVLDYGFDGETRPFFTMTYLPKTMTILEAGQERSFDQKIELTQQLLQALAYLHRRGVLHRDIKPDNVLFNSGGVRLLDFGLAATGQASGNDSMGTPLYIAPELFKGNEYSETADLYAVGVLFYELLTGKHPFAPFDYKFVDRVLEEEPDLEDVDERIRPFLVRLLAKQPTERFVNANKSLVALAVALDLPLPAESSAIRESYLQAAKFVGRDAELAQLTAALEKTADGNGSGWLIGGESGVGKSRLLSELRTQALVDGFLVLNSQAKQQGGGSPFQLWREPVRHALVAASEVDNLTASVLLPLVPDIGQLLGNVVEPASELTSQAAQLRFFNALATVLQNTKRPILLILEDLQWSGESLLPIPFLSRQVGQHPWLIVGSYRNDERADLPKQLSTMQLMILNRLTDEMMTELSVAMLGEVGKQPEVVALLQRETEGNAFFAVEVVRALAEAVGRLDSIGDMVLPDTLLPNGIQDVVQRRVSRLPRQARELLNLAAVSGRAIDVPLMQELSNGIDIRNEWLTLCAETAVLEVQQEQWQFNHDKIREGLLAELTAEETVSLNEQVATTLEAIYPDAPEQAARLAYHWGKANQVEKEAAYAFQAGQYAAERYSNQEAIAFFSQALAKRASAQVEKRYEILLAREAVYAISAADRKQQQEDLTILAQLAEALDNPAKRATVALRQSHLYNHTSRFKEAILAAQLVIEQSKLANDESLELEGHTEWGHAANQLKAFDVAQEHLKYSVERNREFGREKELGYALKSLGAVYQDIGRLDDGKACYIEALEIAQRINNVRLESHLYTNLSISANLQGDDLQAQIYAKKALQIYRAIGEFLGEGIFYVNSGIDLYRFGDYQQAVNHLKSSAHIFRQADNHWGETLAMFFLSLVAERFKNYAETKTLLEESINSAKTLNLTKEVGERLVYLGFVYKQQGQFKRAETLFAQADVLLLNKVQQSRATDRLRFNQARMAYEQQHWAVARALYVDLIACLKEEEQFLFVSTHSGLASVHLAEGDVKQALIWAEPAIEYLLNEPLVDGWHSMRVATECYHILLAANDGRADAVLKKAYDTLQARTQLVEDEAARRYTLEEVPEHREIVRLYKN